MFYPGDTYNFILNIPTVAGTPTVMSAPLITILDITNPSVPIVTAQSMTFITGTSFLYYYSFLIPNASPKDYIAIYSYGLSNSESLGTATAATWTTGIASYTFPLPLPANAIPGAVLTTTGFTSGGPGSFNVTNAPIQTVNLSTGVITVAIVSNPGTESILGTGVAIINTTIANQLLESTDKLHVGDSYITGPVALNATLLPTVATALAAFPVMKSTQYIAPMNDPTVQNINTNVTTVLANTNSQVTLLGTLTEGTVSGLLQDVYDNVFGSWSIDQISNPPVLSIKRINGAVIATFQLINNSSVTQRNVLTSPPESNV